MVYSSFQVLEQAIEATGSTDKAVVSEYIASNSFDTVMGTISWDEHNNNSSYWTVGQWQGGVSRALLLLVVTVVAAQPKWVGNRPLPRVEQRPRTGALFPSSLM